MSTAFDPSILQDFLTESGELLEQLEGDLVQLERTPTDPELVNKVFRALHTIKGSASFLSLTNLVEIAHAAEGALNAARNRIVTIDAAMMTFLLHAVDTIKTQMAQLAAGEELVAPDEHLVASLTELSLGKQSTAAKATAPAKPEPAPQPAAPQHKEPADSAFDLPPNKADLLEFLVADLDETLAKIDQQIAQLAADATRSSAAAALVETGDALVRSVDFFEFEPMSRLARLLSTAGESAAKLERENLDQLLPRVQAVAHLLGQQSKALSNKKLVAWPIDTLVTRVSKLAAGEPLDEGTLPATPSIDAVLTTDGVTANPALSPSPTPAPGQSLAPTEAHAPAPGATPPAPPSTSAAKPAPKAEPDAKAETKPDSKSEKPAAADQTIRVEVGRLEVLMNLVGELVLQKNRITALSRQVAAGTVNQDTTEALTIASGSLDRITGDIQLAVMRTRMQPLEKIFGKYPRLIRDLSMKTGKRLELVIEGGDTEVDKSVIEELGDPLVHLLRNAADHGIEMPDARRAAGKSETGTITLRASHEGSHVLVQVKDDGKGLLREKIGAKAIERGLITEANLATLSDREVFRFIFEAGFSTAEKVTDLSGRGVGMDVVRSNIEKIKGTIELESDAGKGTTVSIKIPLTIAIMPAMMVGLGGTLDANRNTKGGEIYAIPLGNVVEIVKPEPSEIVSIRQHPVMRLRDSILPLVRGPEVFGLSNTDGSAITTPFAVVLAVGEKRFGLLVSRLIGQQEIVIKRLDELCDKKTAAGGPVSGATVRDDGGVSLIVDVTRLLKIAEANAA